MGLPNPLRRCKCSAVGQTEDTSENGLGAAYSFQLGNDTCLLQTPLLSMLMGKTQLHWSAVHLIGFQGGTSQAERH